MKKNQNGKEQSLLKTVFFILPFVYGIFYEWSSCIIGIFLCMDLFIHEKNEKYKKKMGVNAALLITFVLLYFITCLYAVDYGMAFLGFVKFLPLILFVMRTMDLEKKEVHELLSTIPITASAMTLISVLAYPTPFRKYFFKAGRLGGFFQYSNTFALYLLIGMLILFFGDSLFCNDKKLKIKTMQAVIMGAGILITGSRSVFVFSIAGIFVFFLMRILKKRVIREKETTDRRIKQNRFFISIGTIVMIGIVVLFSALSGNMDTLKRYWNMTTESGTFLGRLLYYKDAIHMIGRHPMGWGYLGYRYASTSEQTGVYYTRYVHNEFLQAGLDIGIVGMSILLVLLIRNILSKHNGKLQKMIFILISAHALFDFDLQYLYMDFILLLCMDWNERVDSDKNEEKAEDRKNGTITSKKSCQKVMIKTGYVFTMILLLYMSIPLMLEHFGKHKEAVKCYAYYTEAKINRVLQIDDEKQQWKMAEEIIKQNPYCADAYYVSAICAANQKDYEFMQKRQLRLIRLEKYKIDYYEQYIKMLSYALEYYVKESDEERIKEYAQYVVDIPKMLEDVKEQTSALAYKIHDRPNLALKEEYVEYIHAIDEYLNATEKDDE